MKSRPTRFWTTICARSCIERFTVTQRWQRYAINPAKPIRIAVDNGHVTLYGVVDTPLDKQLASNQANSVAGVFSIDNQLIVSNQQPK